MHLDALGDAMRWSAGALVAGRGREDLKQPSNLTARGDGGLRVSW
jgi:hypothetical protein